MTTKKKTMKATRTPTLKLWDTVKAPELSIPKVVSPGDLGIVTALGLRDCQVTFQPSNRKLFVARGLVELTEERIPLKDHDTVRAVEKIELQSVLFARLGEFGTVRGWVNGNPYVHFSRTQRKVLVKLERVTLVNRPDDTSSDSLSFRAGDRVRIIASKTLLILKNYMGFLINIGVDGCLVRLDHDGSIVIVSLGALEVISSVSNIPIRKAVQEEDQKDLRGCTCMDDIAAPHLKEDETIHLGFPSSFQLMFILSFGLTKVAKGKAQLIVAKYCPFCGKEYPG